MYESDITRFIREMKARNPQLEESQRKGRSLLWDRPQDPELTRQAREARVPQKPYVYQTES
ncbi:DUF3460 family protein [Burkholderiaceae bacterium FT117]|uniref:DUF3460 family protein n=1 Tax=Zeimonas sediminis TaxID=2944268 RepID=UPI002342DA42|nr:DUF3460 family protein [Zeimonas sediminis]MCM5569687.1 DUF3460 family protein [Zeimonas sediminis]